MTERSREPHYETIKEDHKRVDGVMRLLEAGIKDDFFNDPVERALFKALLPQLANDGILRPHLTEVFSFRRQVGSFFPVAYALRTLEFSIDKQMQALFDEDEYPGFFQSHAWWHHRNVFQQLDYFTFHEDMRHNLQSNMHNAYAIYPLLAHAYKDRYGQTPTVLDNGGSLALGLKKMLLDSENPFSRIKVVMPPRRGEPIVPGEMRPDEEFQEIVDYLATRPTPIEAAVTYDTLPINPDDTEAIARVRSHTFPMSESTRRPDELAEFDRLVELRNPADQEPKVKILRDFIDATDEYMLSRLEDYLPSEGADMGIYSAVLFEHEPAMAAAILENTSYYYREYAPVFITDFAHANPSEPNGLRFVRGDWWHRPGSFALFVKDPLIGDLPIELARFSNRRGEEMWLSNEGREVLRRAAAAA